MVFELMTHPKDTKIEPEVPVMISCLPVGFHSEDVFLSSEVLGVQSHSFPLSFCSVGEISMNHHIKVNDITIEPQ